MGPAGRRTMPRAHPEPDRSCVLGLLPPGGTRVSVRWKTRRATQWTSEGGSDLPDATPSLRQTGCHQNTGQHQGPGVRFGYRSGKDGLAREAQRHHSVDAASARIACVVAGRGLQDQVGKHVETVAPPGIRTGFEHAGGVACSTADLLRKHPREIEVGRCDRVAAGRTVPVQAPVDRRVGLRYRIQAGIPTRLAEVPTPCQSALAPTWLYR